MSGFRIQVGGSIVGSVVGGAGSSAGLILEAPEQRFRGKMALVKALGVKQSTALEAIENVIGLGWVVASKDGRAELFRLTVDGLIASADSKPE